MAENTKTTEQIYAEIDRVYRINAEKVLNAFTKNRVAASHFAGTNGYGYDDTGRDVADKVFADVLGKEKAIVRYAFANGTHALSTALFGILRPNDTVLFYGEPYDTLKNVIWGKSGSLTDWGVKAIIADALLNIPPQTRVIYIQRSRGYLLRDSMSVSEINLVINVVREIYPTVITLVDNCYGEFCEETEPDADLIVGSLIKNLGAGIAQTGGYIAGRADLVEQCADRLYTVGTGFEIGCTLNSTREILSGLFRAPSAVASARKSAAYAAEVFKNMGYDTYFTNDITLIIKLGSADKLKQFCHTIQANSPVDSHLTPEPWAMPGYDCDVIMAAGGFVSGASIELSADAPLREPYCVYLQGGIDFEMARIAIDRTAAAIGHK
ncbi:MAG: methionine gamma-lyase family protein [Oscillospiraceae bacterium]|jgi:cystathionine beta-lyase family protein involved in aluminum resistance|nr:methionine gamma-lyase family protein [Oscillospiraceae bacterium]